MTNVYVPRTGLFLTAVLVITVAVYLPGLSGGFLFDDYPNLIRDEDWKVHGGTWMEWLRALSHGIASPAGRPLALLSFATNHYLAGMDPYAYKLTNLVWHLGNGLLAFTLCRLLLARLTGGPALGQRAAVVLAALWLLHPLQVSSVLYIVQRMEIAAASGVLLSLIGYILARTAAFDGRRSWTGWLLAGTGLLLGMGFKESAALAPGFAFLIEATVFRFRRRDGSTSWPLLSIYGAGALIALAAYLHLVRPFFDEGSLYAIRDFDPWERLLSQLRVLVLYLQQILIPIPESMTFYYDNFAVSRGVWSPPSTLWAGLALVALLTFAWGVRRTWPLTTLGIAWFLMAHALTSNLVPLELVFEHRNYLALLGVLMALTQPVAAVLSRLNLDARVALAGVVTLALVSITMTQTATWGEPLRLAWTLENRNPESPRANYDLGRQLVIASGDDVTNPTWSMALQTFRYGAALQNPSPLAAHGIILMQGRADRPIANDTWQQFRNALTRKVLTPEGLSSLHAVSNCRISRRCQLNENELLSTFLEVLERNRDSAAVHTLYADFAWNVLADQALAIDMQRESVRLTNNQASNQAVLAQFLAASDDSLLREEAADIATELRAGDHTGSLKDALSKIDALIAAQTAVESVQSP